MIIINSLITFDNYKEVFRIPEICRDIAYNELIFLNQEYITAEQYEKTAEIFNKNFEVKLNKEHFKNVIFDSTALKNNITEKKFLSTLNRIDRTDKRISFMKLYIEDSEKGQKSGKK